ncbi:MAG: tetratricopeptide repeat protein [Syntrophorhabdaceae bacterium]|nr:tetratricopeptide repeat protein [Syntrophorhabdaceae bacterium]
MILAAFAGTCFGDSSEIHIPDGPIASAMALVEGKHPFPAIKELESYTPEFSELSHYYYVFGHAQDAAGDLTKAASSYRFASLYATEAVLQETALLLAAETELNAGYRFEAKNICEIFLKRFPNSDMTDKVRILLGRSLAGIGRYRDAIRQFEMAGDAPRALFGKANTLQRMGMTSEATRAYSEAMAKNAEFPEHDDETRLWMGENLRLSGMSARAKNLLSKVKDPENLDYAVFGLAEIAAKVSKNDSVILRFEKLASSKNRKLGRIAALRAAELEASTGKLDEAAQRLEELIAKYPFTAEYDHAMLLLARIRVVTGDDAGAVSLLLRLVARQSSVRAKALDEMEHTLLAARAKGPEYVASIWDACGHWLMDPSRESSLVVIADELRGYASCEKLEQWLSRYGSNPVRTKYLERQVEHFAAAGDADGIRSSLQRLRNLNASGDILKRAEGSLKLAEKDYVGAEQALLSLERMDVKDIEMLGEILPSLKDPAKTIAALEEAVSSAGVSHKVLLRLADTHFEAGRKDKAIEYYRMAADEEPEDEWSCYRLFMLLGENEGGEYRKRIVKDKTLAQMADAVLKERNRNGK